MINQLWDFMLYIASQAQMLWDFLFSAPNPDTLFGQFLLDMGINAPVYIVFSGAFIILFISIKIVFWVVNN